MKDKAVGSDIIFAERRGQSQKPTEIYELIEELVPGGKYLEIFARKNNLRDYWRGLYKCVVLLLEQRFSATRCSMETE